MKKKKTKEMLKIKADLKAVQLKSPTMSPKPPSSSLFSKNLLQRSKHVRLTQRRCDEMRGLRFEAGGLQLTSYQRE